MNIETNLSSITDYLLHAQWVAWAVRFVAFYILARWVGIRWYLLMLLLVVLEVCVSMNWSFKNSIDLAMHKDAWISLGAGLLGIYLGQRAR